MCITRIGGLAAPGRAGGGQKLNLRRDSRPPPHSIALAQEQRPKKGGDIGKLRKRRGAAAYGPEPDACVSIVGFASFAASAIAASAACPCGWMSPADMMSLAASSAEIGSSMTSSAGM
jgi:hypothetical protein